MFKNLIMYRLSRDWIADAEKLESALESERFAPCGATEALSAGWVPPRGEPGARLLEQVDGQWLVSLRVEKRVLPGSVVREALEERIDAIEIETGRRPGKKQQRDLKEQVVHELLPRAFTTSSHIRVWINPKAGLLMVEASAISKADEVITLLVKADPSINLHLLQTAEAPAACMGAWLMDGIPPKDFVIDRDLVLRAADEMKSMVRYGRHNLDTDEVKSHITAGKMPKLMAMTWNERVSFVLTDTMQIKGVKFLDVVFDGREKPAKDEAFDVDMALATGELAQLIPDLIEALGGELDFVGQSAKIAAEHAPAATNTGAVVGATEHEVMLAAKLYEARKAIKALHGPKFRTRMTEVGIGIGRAANAHGIGVVEAAQLLIKEGGLAGIGALEVLAAAVELVEPTP